MFWLFPMLVFAFFPASIWGTILIRFGLDFGALRGQKVGMMSSKFDVEINIDKKIGLVVGREKPAHVEPWPGME